jgi:hypothetical protein
VPLVSPRNNNTQPKLYVLKRSTKRPKKSGNLNTQYVQGYLENLREVMHQRAVILRAIADGRADQEAIELLATSITNISALAC